MYKEILNDIKIALNNGGKTIEISKEADFDTLVVCVKEGKNVYFAYTVGEENKDFMFYLMEFCKQNNCPIRIITMSGGKYDIRV